jgi:hypothetical protein
MKTDVTLLAIASLLVAVAAGVPTGDFGFPEGDPWSNGNNNALNGDGRSRTFDRTANAFDGYPFDDLYRSTGGPSARSTGRSGGYRAGEVPLIDLSDDGDMFATGLGGMDPTHGGSGGSNPDMTRPSAPPAQGLPLGGASRPAHAAQSSASAGQPYAAYPVQHPAYAAGQPSGSAVYPGYPVAQQQTAFGYPSPAQPQMYPAQYPHQGQPPAYQPGYPYPGGSQANHYQNVAPPNAYNDAFYNTGPTSPENIPASRRQTGRFTSGLREGVKETTRTTGTVAGSFFRGVFGGVKGTALAAGSVVRDVAVGAYDGLTDKQRKAYEMQLRRGQVPVGPIYADEAGRRRAAHLEEIQRQQHQQQQPWQ